MFSWNYASTFCSHLLMESYLIWFSLWIKVQDRCCHISNTPIVHLPLLIFSRGLWLPATFKLDIHRRTLRSSTCWVSSNVLGREVGMWVTQEGEGPAREGMELLCCSQTDSCFCAFIYPLFHSEHISPLFHMVPATCAQQVSLDQLWKSDGTAGTKALTVELRS